MACLPNRNTPRNAARLDIHTAAAACAISRLSTTQIGEQFLAILHGRESSFSDFCKVIGNPEKPEDRRRFPNDWSATRLRIFARDGHVCTYCGSNHRLECDHVVPVSRGGSEDDTNLTTACRSCNTSKRDRLISEWMN